MGENTARPSRDNMFVFSYNEKSGQVIINLHTFKLHSFIYLDRNLVRQQNDTYLLKT